MVKLKCDVKPCRYLRFTYSLQFSWCQLSVCILLHTWLHNLQTQWYHANWRSDHDRLGWDGSIRDQWFKITQIMLNHKSTVFIGYFYTIQSESVILDTGSNLYHSKGMQGPYKIFFISNNANYKLNYLFPGMGMIARKAGKRGMQSEYWFQVIFYQGDI